MEAPEMMAEYRMRIREFRMDHCHSIVVYYRPRRMDRRVAKKAAQKANVRPYVAGTGRGEPKDVSHTFRHSIAFRMIRREDKRLEDVMLRLRHSNFQTTDQIYGDLRWR